MSETTLEDLLKAMPSIAKAVNTFTSDAVQQKAFAILMNALDGGLEVEEPGGKGKGKTKTEATPKRSVPPSSKPAKSRRGQAGPPKLKSDLNLRPKGKKSLKDFMAEKEPKTNEERFAAIIYYLEKTLQERAIDRDHIYTCFKELGVKFPLQIDPVLRNAARRKGWINTSNSSDLKMTVGGENFVEHDLPVPQGGNK